MDSDVKNSFVNLPVDDSLTTINKRDTLTKVRITTSIDVINDDSSSMKDTTGGITTNYHANQRSRQKPTISIEQTMHDMNNRLTIGKMLQNRLGIISDLMCILAIISIILMILANELTFNRTDESNTKASWFIKLIITIITMILLLLLIYYHYLDLKLYSNQNSLSHYFIGLTYKKMILILIELAICIIHPFPREFPLRDPPKLDSGSEVVPYSLSYIARDVGLGLPMFLRFYLFGRSILFHSHLVRNISLRSFSYLNHVPIDLSFLIKAALQHWPIRCFLAFCISLLLIGSWSIRACVYESNNQHISMSNAMWLFMVTFATIGYGDIIPSSYCGRAILTIVSLGGILLTALLIAVLANKLHLTRSQKYVHTFVLNTDLAKQRYEHAANVIKYAVLTWYIRRKYKPNSFRYFRAQRRLFHSISCLQQTKVEQKILVDNCIGLHELMTLQQNINTRYETSIDRMSTMKMKLQRIEHRLNYLTKDFNSLMNILNDFLNNIEASSTN